MPENFFVKVINPKHIRIKLLETSRMSLEASKVYFNLMVLREEKSKLVTKIKSQLHLMMSLFTELETKLPNKELLHSIDSSLKKQEESEKKKKKTTKNKPSNSEPLKKESELDALNDALALIEERLRSLD